MTKWTDESMHGQLTECEMNTYRGDKITIEEIQAVSLYPAEENKDQTDTGLTQEDETRPRLRILVAILRLTRNVLHHATIIY